MVDDVAAIARLERPAAPLRGEDDALIELPYLRAQDVAPWRAGVDVVEGTGHSRQWQRRDLRRAFARHLDELR